MIRGIMEQLALELRRGIDIICVTYYFKKEENVIEKAVVLAEKIRKFCGSFLQGNIYGMEDGEYEELKNYVVGVLEDYLEAIEQQDAVYMVDTLDHGLRTLAEIYMDDAKEPEYE